MSLVKAAGRFISDNSPAILTGMGVAGVLSTVYLAAKAGYRHGLRAGEAPADLDLKGHFKLAWDLYIPPAAVAAASIMSIISANNVNAKRQAAIMSVYTLTDKAFSDYREKVVESIGANKEVHIRDEINKDKMRENPVSKSEIIITGNGDVLCFDTLTGRYFESSMEKIRKAVNDVNYMAINDMYASHNEFYRLVGLPITALGEEVGWRSDLLMDVKFTSDLTEDGRPCMAIDYRLSPIRGYYKINGH